MSLDGLFPGAFCHHFFDKIPRRRCFSSETDEELQASRYGVSKEQGLKSDGSRTFHGNQSC